MIDYENQSAGSRTEVHSAFNKYSLTSEVKISSQCESPLENLRISIPNVTNVKCRDIFRWFKEKNVDATSVELETKEDKYKVLVSAKIIPRTQQVISVPKNMVISYKNIMD